jgi:hypothetical protein
MIIIDNESHRVVLYAALSNRLRNRLHDLPFLLSQKEKELWSCGPETSAKVSQF